MSPILALGWSVVLVVATTAFGTAGTLAQFVLIFALLLSMKQRSVMGVVLAVELTLPFAIPLAIVHGVLNPAFPVAEKLFDFIPVRPSGLWFAASVSLRILILTVIVVIWRDVDADRLLRESIRARLPLSVVVIVAVASANLHLLGSKIQVVYLAQQARGVAAGPSLFARIRALPRVVIPVIASTITEGHARGLVMTNRGLGNARLSVRPSTERTIGRDLQWIASGAATCALVWLLQ